MNINKRKLGADYNNDDSLPAQRVRKIGDKNFRECMSLLPVR